MSNLTILNTSVRQFNNLYSLNDLHRLSGGESKHQPTFFVRLDTTKELVVEIQKEDPTTIALQSNNGGVNRGTYACEELVIAYAMWISPKFHLVVLRAFIAMRKAEIQNSTAIQPVAADLQQIIQIELFLFLTFTTLNNNSTIFSLLKYQRKSAPVSIAAFLCLKFCDFYCHYKNHSQIYDRVERAIYNTSE